MKQERKTPNSYKQERIRKERVRQGGRWRLKSEEKLSTEGVEQAWGAVTCSRVDAIAAPECCECVTTRGEGDGGAWSERIGKG